MSLSSKQYTRVGPLSYADACRGAILTPATGEALALGKVVLANRSGSAIDVGIASQLPANLWQAGYIDASATPDYLGESALAKSTTANAFVNIFTTTTTDGFLVAARVPFNVISFANGNNCANCNIVSAYYNGSAMATLPTIADANYAAAPGTKFTSWAAPSDWAKGTTAAVATTLSDFYCVRFTATDAADGVDISDVRVYQMLEFYPQLASNAEIAEEFGGNEIQLPVAAKLVPYFGSASSSNMVWVDYRPLSRQV